MQPTPPLTPTSPTSGASPFADPGRSALVSEQGDAPDPPVLNRWREEALDDVHAHTPAHAYDINFRLPLRVLQTGAVRVQPLIPSQHLAGLLALPRETWAAFPDFAPATRAAALEAIERFRRDEQSVLLAVVDKAAEARGRDGFAGVYGVTECGREMTAVFGLIVIAPAYRRTHVNTHAMYLVLDFLFGAGVVRVQYDAALANAGSIWSAQRFGFTHEGVARNLNGAPAGRDRDRDRDRDRSRDLAGEGQQGQRDGSRARQEGKGADDESWLGSMTDRDWTAGARDRLYGMVAKPIVSVRN
ncbi:hypothetical protein Q5752_006515 [Cryptotrichosporon argae]